MTQQENLKEFMNRRMAELGLGYKDVANAGIGAQTFQNIRQGVPFKMQDVTKQKLAALLKCSIGDINAALANTDAVTPFGEVVIKEKPQPSVMETVDRLEEMVQEQYPEEAAAEEPEDMPGIPEPVADKTKPKTKKIDSADIAAPKKVKVLKQAIKPEKEPAMTVEEYRQRLKDMCLQQFVSFGPSGGMESAYVSIAKVLLKELMEE